MSVAEAITPAPLPPQDLRAERELLGGLFLDPSRLDDVLEILGPEDFYSPRNRAVFAAMVALRDQSEPVDALTVANHVRPTWRDSTDPAIAVAALAGVATTSALCVQRAREVRAAHVSLRLVEIGQQIAAAGWDRIDPVAAVAQAEAAILALSGERETGGPKSVTVAIAEFNAQLERRFDGTESPGLPTGFADVDEMILGLGESDLAIVGARPSMGKTAYATQIAVRVATKCERAAVVFSLEQAQAALARRLVASTGGVDATRLRSGRLQDGDWDRIMHAVARLQQAPLFIDDTPSLAVGQLRSRARRLALRMRETKTPLGLVVVDYLQLVTVGYAEGRRVDSREQEIAYVSRSLKALAKELRVPVIALCQLNRDLERRADKRPTMADLRESGQIEQDADLIQFLYRDEVYNQNTQSKGVAEVITAKQREGSTGTVTLAWEPQFTRFRDAAHARERQQEIAQPQRSNHRQWNGAARAGEE